MIGMWMQVIKRRFYFTNNNASIGIGAMIVFIAMVLVAGIAASVLITTSNTLKNQALKSGGKTEDEVSVGIRVYQIIGQYNTRRIGGTDYSRYHNMSIVVTPCAGTDGIDLTETVIKIVNESKKVFLSYGNVFVGAPSGNGIFLLIKHMI